MFQFSLKTILLATLYVAVVCLVYTTRNSAAGGLAVAVTALVLSLAIYFGACKRSVFLSSFGFAGTMTLVVLLTFTFDSKSTSDSVNRFRYQLAESMNLGRELSYKPRDKEYTHGLFESTRASSNGGTGGIPTWTNLLKLFACLAAVAMGTICGGVIVLAKKLSGTRSTANRGVDEAG